MNWMRLSSVSLAILFTSPLSAQQESDDEDDQDVVAAEDFVRELRSESQAPESVSAESIDEWLAGSSQALDAMAEQGCELDARLSMRIQAIEVRIESASSGEGELVSELKLGLVNLRQQALRDCCEQDSVVCFQ